ncbi:quinone oxidoreductase family protein [Rhizobium halophytocola]|uniref:NADPH:quinone reductase-like Zn-dependent oxidoreductase n=1 Tax=Rhizobium halophytocola TaxID=735519 RepID=A0ABS4E5M9_9HYPH|nr:zinc-binding alcohol dehydrogenase family protein [Rhizobium halophytocola]MBP1853250.1 NADPH:quinone reductase-like Zn-dependent oxidoreductase [Rhizobium halophytocola]
MKAAVYDTFGPPEVLRYETVDDPVCQPDGVVIRVEAIAVEGGDLFARNTISPPSSDHVGGYAAAGAIIQLGSNVHDWSVGDRVATIAVGGSHAELRAVPARTCFRVPDGLDMARAAAVPVPFLTAHHALFRVIRLRPEDTLVVQGAAGSVGLAAIQLAAGKGSTVLAIQSGTKRMDYLRALGATDVMDRHAQDTAEFVRQSTEGRMASVVLETVGGATLDTSIAVTRPFGQILLIGNASQAAMRPDLWPAMTNNISLLGVSLRASFAAPSTRGDIEDMLRQVERGKLAVALDRTFSLQEAAAAHRYIEENSVLGRVILRP